MLKIILSGPEYLVVLMNNGECVPEKKDARLLLIFLKSLCQNIYFGLTAGDIQYLAKQ